MARNTEAFNITTLFNLAFRGQVAPPYPGSKAEKARVEILKNGYSATPLAQQQAQRSSILGTPIFMPCTIDGFELPNEPLITIEIGKSIVRTDLAGYNGSVKENMGLGDYEIVIQGVATNDQSDDYPEATVRRLREIFEKKKEVSIVSPLMALFGIHFIAIERLRLPAVEGQIQFTGYEFQCFSDMDVSLIIRDAIL